MKKIFTFDFVMGFLIGFLVGILTLFLIAEKEIESLMQDKEEVKKKEAIFDKALDYVNETEIC